MTPPDIYGWRTDPAVPDFDDSQPLIVFDGDCVLCSRSMRLILRFDRARRFRLTPAQGEIGQALYRHLGLPTDAFETYLLIADGRIYQRSTAVAQIARRLGWPWKAGAALAIIPRPVRDALYNLVARHRYRLFGRKAACGIADPALRDRML
ncbi:thiol-disulfide oxidoreductase DCC family protein [Parasphingopyxis sp.]|uniref:thiol-disulfide oxidoreductase DCC family protein n=1 Tax=Parasphingopyxis sp. TaxID=1920299 RepID=UPI00262D15ED|nr:DCC1-like thiol-disulfide oxidoreductase family protein [Parasphingopyxis sp.]